MHSITWQMDQQQSREHVMVGDKLACLDLFGTLVRDPKDLLFVEIRRVGQEELVRGWSQTKGFYP